MSMQRIVITGAAGLVGQNLIARLTGRPEFSVVAIDKHKANTALLRRMYRELEVIEADLSVPGAWSASFESADAVIINQAQIGGLDRAAFIANNVTATEHILAAAASHHVNYLVQISSSVVNSMADDFYVETKRAQEALLADCAIPHVVLRPTLMFGWFDRKHLGWLRRFMERNPIFPIPGDGRFMRQPLYAGDLAAIIIACLERKIEGIYDISGQEKIEYGALIRLIHKIVQPRARIIHIAYPMFWALLWLYARFDRDPPFTTRQLQALVLPETFPVIDWPGIFGVRATGLEAALREAYLDPRYAHIVLDY
jgi:nucleoside-diphosphate-sugar epimerase